MAFFAEQFNSIQNKEKVLFLYYDDTRESLNQDQLPDLIVDYDIQDIHKKIHLSNLRFTIGSKNQYYKELLNAGKVLNKQLLVPLSFNLPLLAYRHTPGYNEFPLFLNIEDIPQHAITLNKSSRYEYNAIGFSPLWDLEALYISHRLLGLQYFTKNETFYFPPISLTQSHQMVSDWVGQFIPDLYMEELFRDKYRNTPGEELLRKNLVKFFFYPSNKFFQTFKEVQKENLFSWFSFENQTPAIENFLLAAIPTKANNTRGAKKFLKWLLNAKTQKILIDKKIQVGYESFGLCDGFSSIKSVNQNTISKVYPAFKLAPIPSEKQILFPKSVPIGYAQAKDQVIAPWLYKKLLNRQEMELSFEIDRWVKQQIFYH